jgi:hypothetical protein
MLSAGIHESIQYQTTTQLGDIQSTTLLCILIQIPCVLEHRLFESPTVLPRVKPQDQPVDTFCQAHASPPQSGTLCPQQVSPAREFYEIGQALRFSNQNPPPEISESIIPSPGVINHWVRTVVTFSDQTIPQQSFNRPIQCTWSQDHPALGSFFHGPHDSVTVFFTIAQCKQNVKHCWGKREVFVQIRHQLFPPSFGMNI